MSALMAVQLLPGCDAELQAAQRANVEPSQYGYHHDDQPTMIQSLADGGVAVVRVHGPIVRRRSYWSASWQTLELDLQLLDGNSAISAIVLDIDSPGGMVYGCGDACQSIANLSKPVVAFVSGQCMSAALRVACSCRQIVMSADAEIGNVGTRISLDDFSESNRQAGVQRIDFVTGWAKAIGSFGAPVTEPQKRFLQSHVEALQVDFVQSLRQRGLSADQIQAVSSGEWWRPEAAMRLGLADAVGSLGDVVAKLGASPEVSFVSTQERAGIMTVQNSSPAAPAPAMQPVVAPLSSLQLPEAPVAPQQTAAPQQAAAPQTTAPESPVAPQQPAAPQQEAAPAAPQQAAAPQQPAAPESPVAAPQQQAAPVSPVAQTPAAAPQQEAAPQPASYQEIVDACMGQTPTNDFVVSQLKAGATVDQARQAFVDQLVASQAYGSPSGVKPGQFTVDSASSADGEADGAADNVMISVEQQISELMKSDNLSRMAAAQKYFAANPAALEGFQKANREMTPQQRAARKQFNNSGILAQGMTLAN